jgi:tetratricopeptide (TPR) repeat protein
MSSDSSFSKIGKTVGERLRAARLAHNYTQNQLASPDFSVSYISAIERGQIHPSLRALEILANRLGLSSTQLLPSRTQSGEDTTTPINAAERELSEADSMLLGAELLIRQGGAVQAIERLEKFSSKRLKQSQLLQHRYLLGWAYFEAHQLQEAIYTLEEATNLAKDANNSYLHTRVLNLLAKVHAALHNYDQALLCHQRCLNLLEAAEPRDFFMIAEVYMHMGQHYADKEHFDQALELFNKSLEAISQVSTPSGIQETYWNLCQYYVNAKEFDTATRYAYKSLHLYEQEASKRQRSGLYHALAQAMMKENPEQAQVYLDEMLQKSNGKQDPLVLASILTHKAELLLAHQELAEAEQDAHKAHEITRTFGDSLIAAETLILLGQIEYAKSKRPGDAGAPEVPERIRGAIHSLCRASRAARQGTRGIQVFSTRFSSC